MQPLALILNIAIVVGIIGIVVYWVRRFAVFLAIKPLSRMSYRLRSCSRRKLA